MKAAKIERSVTPVETMMKKDESPYQKFILMTVASMVLMYGGMYLNTYEFAHVWWSQTRFYMTLIMGSLMAGTMLLFMRKMYKNKKKNGLIVGGSALLFLGALYLVRSQNTIGDQLWMKGMIPHHSIAILTSERAHIQDLRVQNLAQRIVTAQREEIKEMEWLIEDIKSRGAVTTPDQLSGRPVPEMK